MLTVRVSAWSWPIHSSSSAMYRPQFSAGRQFSPVELQRRPTWSPSEGVALLICASSSQRLTARLGIPLGGPPRWPHQPASGFSLNLTCRPRDSPRPFRPVESVYDARLILIISVPGSVSIKVNCSCSVWVLRSGPALHNYDDPLHFSMSAVSSDTLLRRW